ncbi:DUF2057 family protein [Citrobacter portucalensis]|uniref:DUF2057 family protein n=1 Tax=Citrobacter portucalensis TaxID=1639133 RepID=UPI00226B1B45|nr:DUF2057 family protein [Citrobacter portucalensis]MCX9024062.1 DUF2057 family protein [Citrobacter portucalensis]MCX9061475.1 DUF2057 family protein [Citrobacter portucalensis]
MKMILKTSLSVLLLLCSHTLFAQSTLELPDGISLYVLNGKAYDQDGFIFGPNNDVNLQEGENQIVFKFKTSVKQGTDDIRTYDSDTIIAKFNVSSEQVRMVMPNYWTISEAEEKIKNLTWQLKTNSGKIIPHIQDVLPGKGLPFTRDYEKEARKYNQNNGIAALDTVSSIRTQVPANPSQVGSDVSTGKKISDSISPEMQATALDMLKYWYDKADDSTRNEFEDYIASKN